eukprot:1013027-Amphidinium_carterae.1
MVAWTCEMAKNKPGKHEMDLRIASSKRRVVQYAPAFALVPFHTARLAELATASLATNHTGPCQPAK